MALLDVKNVRKVYTTRFGGNQVEALKDVNFSVEQGEYVAIMGESGSGKSTLLNILAALDKPTEGKVFLKEKDLSKVKEKEMAAFRRNNLGFVFQDFNLLDTFSLKDNIFLPLVLSGTSYREMERRLLPLADKLGIKNLLEKYPYEVSGGQKQRVAVAGIIAMKPKCIVLDEPTAMLDPSGRKEVIDTVMKLNREEGITIVLITHYMDEAVKADRVVVMDDGKIKLDGTPEQVFSDTNKIKSLSLEVPQSTELVSRIGISSEKTVLNFDQCADLLYKYLQKDNS